MQAGLIRVLVVHGAYQHRGGEDSVVEAEIALLRSHEHEVAAYFRNNDDIAAMPAASVAIQTLWSSRAADELSGLIQAFSPDVIHVHNTLPLISPSIYWAADSAGVPVVQTLHNFRLMCLSALYLREGKVCEDCVGHLPWRGIVHKCYRGSVAASAVLAGMLGLHRSLGTYRNKVTRYIALNDFCRNKFIEGGLPAKLIVVKPNFVDAPAPQALPRRGILFVGRLSVEKGVESLVNAAALLPVAQLRVVGDGPQAALLDGVQGITKLGALSGEAVQHEMNSAVALVIPSIWYENFPRTIVEAFAAGLPVIASRIGALAELVSDGETGLLFEPGNAQDLASKMDWALAHSEQMAEMGRRARAKYEAEFTAEQNYAQLIGIYEDAIRVQRDED
jgi:glycosyltransferase involved in cell wall biosynthesis